MDKQEKLSRFYRIWKGMISRCNYEKHGSYPYYGGRGIRCTWYTYDDFKKDMFSTYEEHVFLHGEFNTSIDRINNDGHYCKENCRWTTRKLQANNRRKYRYNSRPSLAGRPRM